MPLFSFKNRVDAIFTDKRSKIAASRTPRNDKEFIPGNDTLLSLRAKRSNPGGYIK
ncbi:MAG: hypothetical protein U9P63_02060 [Patescibacteria group bacterium]|nr:hypothetical protein [Patescibacteria group bacterium]